MIDFSFMPKIISISRKYVYIYIFAFVRHFYPKRLTVHSGNTFIVSMCSLGCSMKIFFFYICAFSCHRRHAFISDPLPVIRVPTRRRYGNVTGGHAQPTAEHRGGHTQKRSPPDEEQVHTHLSHVLQLMHQCACSHLTFYLHVAGRRRASVAKKRKNMLSAWRIASLCWKTRTRLS